MIKLIKNETFSKTQIKKIVLANTVANLGSSLFSFGLGIMIITKTNSSMNFALTQLVMPIATFFWLPFLGPIIDKGNRKKIIIVSQIISITVLMIYSLLFNKFANSIVLMTMLLIFVLKSCDLFVTNSFASSIINLVRSEDVSKLKGYQQTGNSISSLIAPFLGITLYGILPFNYFVLFESITEIFALIVVVTVNFKFYHRENFINKSKSNHALFLEGIKFMIKQKYLLGITVFSSAINFLFSSLSVGLPIIMLKFLKASDFEYGIVSTSFIVGLIISGIIIAKKDESEYPLFDSWRALLVMGGLYLLFCPISLFVDSSDVASFLYSVLYFMCGVVVNFVNIPFNVWISKNVPNELQGRVNSIETSLSLVVLPLGLVLYGTLFNLEIADNMLLTSSIFLISGVLYFLFTVLIVKIKKIDFKKSEILK